MINLKFVINEETGRLDTVLASIGDMSRSKVQRLIDNNKVLVNDLLKGASYKVKKGDIIVINDLLATPDELTPTNIPLDIVYEDKYLLVINKQSGLVTHPAPGHTTDTLVNALLYHYKVVNDGSLRPGIVHRLDKDTSGLMLVAKTERVHDLLSEMIKEKNVERHYLAIVDGVINHETGTIDAPIGRDPDNRLKMKVTSINSKNSITHFKVLKRFKANTLIECILETGRTHQIRVHLNYINHPVSNDPVYGKHKKKDSFGQMLHSKSIRLIHPITGEELYFECDPPKEFTAYLNELEKNS